MEFEWDIAKDGANITKHGVSLGDAVLLDWVNGTTLPDTRFNYGERRFVRYALIGNRLFACTFTQRGMKHRIISLRKANKREIRTYGRT